MTTVPQRIAAEIPRLRRYARALTRDLSGADDLVQDSLSRALSKAHLWSAGTDLRAWLFTILHNQYVNHVRRSMRESRALGLAGDDSLAGAAPDPSARLELRDLDRALARLPEEQRQAVLMIGLEGMAYEEAAAVMNLPVGTVRSRLSRGRAALRRLMSEEAGPPPGGSGLPAAAPRCAEGPRPGVLQLR